MMYLYTSDELTISKSNGQLQHSPLAIMLTLFIISFIRCRIKHLKSHVVAALDASGSVLHVGCHTVAMCDE